MFVPRKRSAGLIKEAVSFANRASRLHCVGSTTNRCESLRSEVVAESEERGRGRLKGTRDTSLKQTRGSCNDRPYTLPARPQPPIASLLPIQGHQLPRINMRCGMEPVHTAVAGWAKV